MGNATRTLLSAALPSLVHMCLPTPHEIPAFRFCTLELQVKSLHRRPASVPIPALRPRKPCVHEPSPLNQGPPWDSRGSLARAACVMRSREERDRACARERERCALRLLEAPFILSNFRPPSLRWRKGWGLGVEGEGFGHLGIWTDCCVGRVCQQLIYPRILAVPQVTSTKIHR